MTQDHPGSVWLEGVGSPEHVLDERQTGQAVQYLRAAGAHAGPLTSRKNQHMSWHDASV